MQHLCILLLIILSTVVRGQAPPVRVDYVDTPEPEWQRGLGPSVPGDGNGVFLSPPTTISLLYVTARDGSLHAIATEGGALVASIVPDPVQTGWTIRSASGVAFSYGGGGQNSNNNNIVDPFLVYAITDVPPVDDYTSRVQSRIVAVRHGSVPTLLWISATDLLPNSEIAGTPVISSDGLRIFFTRNSAAPPPKPPTIAPSSVPPTSPPSVTPTTVPSLSPPPPVVVAPLAPNATNATVANNTTSTTTGGRERTLQEEPTTGDSSAVVAHFMVLNAVDGTLVRNEPSTDLLLTNHKYAPVGMARNVTTLLFTGGIEPTTAAAASDLIVWHSAGDAVLDGGGETQLYQYVSPNVTDAVKSKQLNSVSWVTHGPPLLTTTGELFFVTTDGQIRGWTDGRHFDLTPNFQVTIDETAAAAASNATDDAPLYVNGLLYVTNPSHSHVTAVSIQDGKVVWKVASRSGSPILLARPVVSPDYQRLYVGIGSELHVVDALTGSSSSSDNKAYWKSPFANEDGSLIVADPVVSYDGRYIYYVGIQAQIVTSVKVGRSIAPTMMPSHRPSAGPSFSRAPSPPPVSPAPRMPVVVVPSSPVKSATTSVVDQEEEKSNVPLLAGSIGGGLAGLLLLIGLGYYGYRRYRSGAGGGGEDGIDPDYRYDYGAGTGGR